MSSVSVLPRSEDKADPLLDSKPQGRYRRAVDDLAEGLSRSWLWRALAFQDIRLRYRGSMLGPFWLTLSTAIMIGALGVLYAKLFRMETRELIPFLATGLVIWQFLSGVITEGCTTFIGVRHVIQQAKIPYSVHVYRIVSRNLLILAHNIVLIPVVFLVIGQAFSWRALLAVPGAAVLTLNGVWISLLLGMLSARFGDIPPIVASFLQVVFFITPVFWMPQTLGEWRSVAELNPLFAAIDVVRAPLLGVETAPYSWAIMAAMTFGGCAVTFLLFARFRSRIAYWV